MKSGIAIFELWEKLRKKTTTDEGDKQLMVELIETGLKEAYQEGQQGQYLKLKKGRTGGCPK